MAIAFDHATDGGNVVPGTSLTFSHTCTGSNLLLFVCTRESTSATKITGVTYAGTSMNLLATNHMVDNSEVISVWYLAGPSTGANNVVVSLSSSITCTGSAASYTGCNQTGIPDAFDNTARASTGTSITDSVTSIADNCWAFMFEANESGASSAGTGTTLRLSIGSGEALFDNAAAKTPPGSISLQATWGISSQNCAIMATFAPVGATATTKRLAALGVG